MTRLGLRHLFVKKKKLTQKKSKKKKPEMKKIRLVVNLIEPKTTAKK